MCRTKAEHVVVLCRHAKLVNIIPVLGRAETSPAEGLLQWTNMSQLAA